MAATLARLANVEYFYLKCNKILGTNYTVNDWGGTNNKLRAINIEWLVAATRKVYNRIHAPKSGCTALLSNKFSSNTSKLAVTVVLVDKVINYLRNFNKICDVDCNCYKNMNCNCVCKSNCTCDGVTNCYYTCTSIDTRSVSYCYYTCSSVNCNGSACNCNCDCECACGSTSECDDTRDNVPDKTSYPCNCTILFPTANCQCTQPKTENCAQCACTCNCDCVCQCTCTCPNTGGSGTGSGSGDTESGGNPPTCYGNTCGVCHLATECTGKYDNPPPPCTEFTGGGSNGKTCETCYNCETCVYCTK